MYAKSKYKVPLTDGDYQGEMDGYAVEIKEGPITTSFTTTIGVRTAAPVPVKVKITEGYAEIEIDLKKAKAPLPKYES